MTALPPFLSFLTPTFRRPEGLARCLASVSAQTDHCEQIVICDHVGVGIDGMYRALPRYASALHGEYVHLLADDDALYGPHVARALRDFATMHGMPPVVIVQAIKSGTVYPLEMHGPPVQGRIDLGCLVVRRDVWTAHVGDYGARYEGDFDFAHALWSAGHAFCYAPFVFEVGPASHGRPE